MAVNPFQYAVSAVKKKATELFNQSPVVQGAQMYGRMAQSKPVQNFVQQALSSNNIAKTMVGGMQYLPGGAPLQNPEVKKIAIPYMENRYVKPIQNIPNAWNQAFNKKSDLATRGQGALGLVGGAFSFIPDPIGDVAMPIYDAYKGLSKARLENQSYPQTIDTITKSLTWEKPVGLGDAFSKDPQKQMIGNLGELPLMIGLTGKLNKKFNAGFTKNQIAAIQNFTPEDRTIIGRFAQLVETGKGKNNLGELGETVHSIAGNLFGQKNTANMTNKQLKNLFDLALKVADSRGKIKEPFSIGFNAQDVRKTLDQTTPPLPLKNVVGERGGVVKVGSMKLPKQLPKETGEIYSSMDNKIKSVLPNVKTSKEGVKYVNSESPSRYIKFPKGGGLEYEVNPNEIVIRGIGSGGNPLPGQGTGEPTKAVRAIIDLAKQEGKTVRVTGISNHSYWKKFGFQVNNYEGVLKPPPTSSSLPKELEGLAGEARKYKSAEEFVKDTNPFKKVEALPRDMIVKEIRDKLPENSSVTYITGMYAPPSIKGKGITTDVFLGKLRDIANATDNDLVEGVGNRYLRQGGERLVGFNSKFPDGEKFVQSLVSKGYLEPVVETGGNSVYRITEKALAQKGTNLTNFYNQAKGVQEADLSIKLPVSPQLKVVNGKLKVKMKPVEGAKLDDPFLKGLEQDRLSAQAQTIAKVPQPPVSQMPKSPILQPEQRETFDNILRSSGDDVKKKVNVFDYLFTTPKEVLKRIGLKDVGENLQKADDGYQTELRTGLQKIRGWMNEVPSEDSSKKIFQHLDGQKVKLSPQETKVAGEIKPYLAEWAKRLKLPDDKRIAEYITHVFDFDSVAKEFDPEVARLIQDKVPSSVYNPFLQKRLGKLGYKEDVWSSLEAYVKRASRKEAFDPVLREVSKEADRLDPETAKYLQRYVSGINMRPSEVENLLDNAIKQSPIGYKLGQRPSVYLSSQWRKAVGRGTLGLNVGSAVRNLTQGVNTYAKLGEKYTLLGYGKLAKRMATNNMDELIKNNILDENIAIDRTMSAKHKAWQALDDTLYKFFDLAEKINRGSAYFGAKAKGIADGMDESKAIEYAKEIVRQTQFKYGPVDSPVLLQRSLGKSVGQFMTYPIKQTEFLKNLVKDKEYKAIVRYVMGSFVVVAGVGKTLGIEPQDFVPWLQNMQQGRFGSPLIQTTQTSLGLLSSDEQKREKAADDLKKSWRMVVPAGTQINKTIEGLTATGRGYGESPSGRIRYPLPQDTGAKIKGAVFGQYGFPQAQEYFDKVGKGEATPLGDTQSATFKALDATGRDQYYQAIMDRRQAGRDAKPKEPSTLDKGTDFIKNLLKTDNTPRKQSFQETDSPIAVEATDNTTQARIKAVEDEEVKMLKELIKSGTSIPQGTPLPSVMKAYGYGSPVKNYEGLNAIQKAKLDGQTDTRATRLYFDTKVPEKVKDSFWKDMGTTRQDAEFKALASLGDTQQASILFNLLKEREWKTDKVNTFIDKNVLTSSVVGKMEDQGLINEAQAKDLKAYIKNQNVKLGKAKPAKGKKPKKLKIPKLKAIKVKYTKLKVKIPKPKKFKSLLAKPKKNKYFV